MAIIAAMDSAVIMDLPRAEREFVRGVGGIRECEYER